MVCHHFSKLLIPQDHDNFRSAVAFYFEKHMRMSIHMHYNDFAGIKSTAIYSILALTIQIVESK
jgi:hypothetical protein